QLVARDAGGIRPPITPAVRGGGGPGGPLSGGGGSPLSPAPLCGGGGVKKKSTEGQRAARGAVADPVLGAAWAGALDVRETGERRLEQRAERLRRGGCRSCRILRSRRHTVEPGVRSRPRGAARHRRRA